MVMREREAYFQGINGYVPKMALSSAMRNPINSFSLGTPAVHDNDIIDTDIDADAVAGTVTLQSYTSDAPYGRTLTMNANADPGAGGIVDVYGFDYLWQPMVERFTFVSGSTAILYGKKAFYSVWKTQIVGAAANATTYDLGLGYRLGLPYKGDLSWAKENGIFVPVAKRPIWLTASYSDADTTSGGSFYVRAPFPGYVSALRGVMGSGGSTTNAATTVELGGASGTAITGLTITLDQDAPGVVVSDVPTTEGYNANNRVRAGDVIEIVHAATTAGGLMTVEVELTPTQFTHPVLTDPQTVSTGDPRGTYEALTDYDSAKEIIIGLIGDPSINAAGNGGLHGIRHVVA